VIPFAQVADERVLDVLERGEKRLAIREEGLLGASVLHLDVGEDPAARRGTARDHRLQIGGHVRRRRHHRPGGPGVDVLARALVRDPKIILLDEPFEGLAPVIVRDLITACRDLADAGQTIVLVEQNLAAALTLAQRAYIINNGHIAHEGPTREIQARPKILERYLGV